MVFATSPVDEEELRFAGPVSIFRHYSPTQRRIVPEILTGPALKYNTMLEDTRGQQEPTRTPIPFTPNWGQGNALTRDASITSPH